MTYQQLKKVYLLYGDERFLVNQKENELVAAAVPSQNAVMNHSIYKENAAAAVITAECDMLPFMADKRVVQVRYSGLFFQGRKEDSELMAAYVENIPDTTLLIFTEEKVDARGALFKAVKKYGECLKFERLKDREAAAYVKKICPELECPDYFAAVVGSDMEKLTGEIEKLRIYTGGGAITKKDVDEVCSKTADIVVFNMAKAVGKRSSAEAIGIYRNMLLAKESPFAILKMLARQLKLILECKYMSGKGKSNAEIAETLAIKEYFVRDYIAQGRNFTSGALIKGIKACYKCDADIKTGRMDANLAVELVIIGMNDRI